MRLLVAGGGTGGHLFPGIAVADEVIRRGAGEVLFVGTSRGIETRAVPAAGYALETLDVSGRKRMGLWGTVRGLVRIPLAIAGSIAILRAGKKQAASSKAMNTARTSRPSTRLVMPGALFCS